MMDSDDEEGRKGNPAVPTHDDSTEYKVGRGRPPKAHQFQPGQSGNRDGRPRGAKGHKTIVQEVASEVQTLTEGGKRRRLSTIQLVFLALRNKALEGDARAFRAYQTVVERYGPKEPVSNGGYIVVPERLTMEEWIAKYGK
jgi:hypothetical protein